MTHPKVKQENWLLQLLLTAYPLPKSNGWLISRFLYAILIHLPTEFLWLPRFESTLLEIVLPFVLSLNKQENWTLTPVITKSEKLHLPAMSRRMEFLQLSKAPATSFSTRMSHSARLQIWRTNPGTSRRSASIPFTYKVPWPLLASLLVYCLPAYLFTWFKFELVSVLWQCYLQRWDSCLKPVVISPQQITWIWKEIFDKTAGISRIFPDWNKSSSSTKGFKWNKWVLLDWVEYGLANTSESRYYSIIDLVRIHICKYRLLFTTVRGKPTHLKKKKRTEYLPKNHIEDENELPKLSSQP